MRMAVVRFDARRILYSHRSCIGLFRSSEQHVAVFYVLDKIDTMNNMGISHTTMTTQSINMRRIEKDNMNMCSTHVCVCCSVGYVRVHTPPHTIVYGYGLHTHIVYIT